LPSFVMTEAVPQAQTFGTVPVFRKSGPSERRSVDMVL
jgi:hypothetical protein